MMTDRHDWLMVQVDQVGEAVRKIAAALLDAGDPEQLVELDEQTDSLLEDVFEHSHITVVDSRTAALILRPPSRIRAYARLLAHKARLVHELGRGVQGEGLARRALELQLEAAEFEPDPDKIDHESIDALLDRDPPLCLGPRHQQLLEALDSTG
ncbi:hypothetical protein ENSA5_51340 [Enhygromyxa salina]|uniref:Uncharacterized protein n=1 Tax=Enhygromyxa salina TaxID=215803 RepID=A0A2S9XH57_9BACT|nr:hypothetical protein [Enhygromyxa salina]PRP92185.1 hypothetical protein ENSA5_51340 [Enhygromyxa salina]